jgi:hypothetical protein
MTVDEALRDMREASVGMAAKGYEEEAKEFNRWADAVEQEREQLRGLLARALAAEGRCSTRLLHEISRALEKTHETR